MTEDQWLARGNFHHILGRKIFVIDNQPKQLTSTTETDDYLTQQAKPCLCILHGFPTSSYDYWKVLDTLAQHFRVIIHDHLGFGFSDKPLDYSYSLIEQTDIAIKLWQHLGISKATILAHDYGTSILTELLARDNQASCPIELEHIVLCNGSVHIELAHLKLMQRLLRLPIFGPMVAQLASINTLRRNLQSIFVDPTQLSEVEVAAIWRMMNNNQGKNVLPQISQYTNERKKFWFRWIGALSTTSLPIEIIWPDKDPIAVAKMAQVIHQETQNSRLYWLNDLGHFPMLEAPKLWSEQVLMSLGYNLHS